MDNPAFSSGKQANYGSIATDFYYLNRFPDEKSGRFRHEEEGNVVANGNNNNKDELVTLKRTVGLFGSIALIVGTQIGSGIFVSPGGILSNAGNVWLSLIIWALSGVLSMFGAMTYIELSTVVPTSGGEYPYIMAAYGSIPGYLNAWANLTLLRPSQLAVICLTCALNMIEPFLQDKSIDDPQVMWGARLICAGIIVLLTYVNCASVSFATRVQIVFTIAKLIGIAVIVGAGIYNLCVGKTTNFEGGFEGSTNNFGKIASAFFSGLWAYDGWNQLSYVAEEIKDPYRNLPRAIFFGIPLVTVCYILVNIAFLTVVNPLEFTTGSVAILFGDRVLGVMSWLMPLVVVLSTLGAGNGVLFASARVTYVAGREGHLPDSISYVDVQRDTPSISLIVNAIISIAQVMFLDVQGLIDFFSYGAWIFYGLTAATLIILRYKMPDAPRPFKTPAWMSLVVVAMSAFLTIATVALDPRWEYLYSVLFIVAGIFLYIPFVHFQMVLFGMESITKAIQLVFLVVPTEGLDDEVLISDLAKKKANQTKEK